MDPGDTEKGQGVQTAAGASPRGYTGFWTSVIRRLGFGVGETNAEEPADHNAVADTASPEADPSAGVGGTSSAGAAGHQDENQKPDTSDSDKNKYTAAEDQNACSKMWNVYTLEAERYDKAVVESWKGDMNGMLIFSGLFSASLTAFLIESYKILQADPADTTVALLTQLVQQSTAMTPVAEASATFEVTTAALVCNTLWFISLALSLTCSLLATLVEQWAREFLHKTDISPAPVRRARVFSFLYRGIQQFHMHTVVDIIPMLLHVSLFLFFGGLVAFLLPVNKVLMYLMACILAVFFCLYTVLTVLPVVYRACPYRTPLSAALWKLRQLVSMYNHTRTSVTKHPRPGKGIRSMIEVVLDEALKNSGERDAHAVRWTVACLTDDEELLRFAEAIPAAISGSKGFHDANNHLFLPLLDTLDPQLSVGRRIVDLLRTSDDPSLDNISRTRRQTACMKAIWALGMLPANDSPNFRFDRSALDVLNMTTLDRHYCISARAAVRFSRWNTFRACLHSVEEALRYCRMDSEDLREDHRTLQSIRHILNGFSEQDRPDLEFDKDHHSMSIRWRSEFALAFSNLRDQCNNESAAPISFPAIKDSVENSVASWHMLGVAILADLLDQSLEDRSCPYDFSFTCQRLSRGLPSNANMYLALEFHVHRALSRLPDRSVLETMTRDIHDIDNILRALLGLLPKTFGGALLNSQESLAYPICRYIANRDSDRAVLHALSHCDTAFLQNSMVGLAINPFYLNGPKGVSEAIWTLCHFMNQNFFPFKKVNLHGWVNSLYPLVPRLHPFPSTKAVVLHFIIVELRRTADSVHWNDSDTQSIESVNAALKELYNHPVLLDHFPERVTFEPGPSMLAVDLYHTLYEQLENLHVSIISEVLSAYSRDTRPYRGIETLQILETYPVHRITYYHGTFWGSPKGEFSPTTQSQRAFACGVENIVRCLRVDKPDAELIAILSVVWGLGVWLYIDDVTSTFILVDAIDLYLSLGVTETGHGQETDYWSPMATRRRIREHCTLVITEAATVLSQLPGYDTTPDSLLG